MITLALAILSGIFWTITYLLMIRRSIQDKSVGIPMVALCLNISWEFIFSFIYPSHKPQLYINYVWFFLDLILVIQFLRFNQLKFASHLSKKFFYPAFFSVLIVGFFNMLFISSELGTVKAAPYTAFEINLVMSILFIHLLLSRDDARGQSIYIAISKMIGTACASVAIYLYLSSSILLNFLYLAILLFDGVYIILLYQKLREQRINAWKRA